MSTEALKLALEALEYWDVHGKLHQPTEEAITALREALANEALDKMAENARELGLDYEPSAGTQVSKVWWDGERLMAKPIPLDDFYEPAQQEKIPLIEKEFLEAEIKRLEHNEEVLMNALFKACGDDAQVVNDTIESQGELK